MTAARDARQVRSMLGFVVPSSLDARRRRVILLLLLATLPAAFVNTVFTQTVAFAAAEFDVSAKGQGFAAAVVRWGVVIALPFALSADRLGRRKMIIVTAWLAPLVTSLGAFAPSFEFLVATQAIGRPLGLALSVFIMVFATEEMGSDTRAWALSVLAIASGVGAGSAVGSLPLAGISESSWRWIYLVGLVWLVCAAIVTRLLPETTRFLAMKNEPPAIEAPRARIDRGRLALQIVVAVFANLFIATVSIFQVRYLTEVRGYSASMAAAFTIFTVLPSSIALVIGGRLADSTGRRQVAVVTIPIGATLIAVSYSVSGPVMWIAALVGGFCIALAYPAMSVFRSELFPTAKRNLASALITTASLLGGSVGLIGAGVAIDDGYSYGAVITTLAVFPLIVAMLVWFKYPETANVSLEELNPVE
ncbi:MAG: MFS transporter [Ilumatobacteraceae bacterium]